MKRIFYLLFAACSMMGANAQTVTLHGADGGSFTAPLRRALPTSADRARYTGFHPDTLLLRKGTVRRQGSMPLPCDIRMLRDVAVTLRDGVTIYTDVFLPAEEGNYPAILAWSPYGKEVGGQMLDDVPMRSGVPQSMTSGLEKFEAPDPAYWCARGYAIVNPDKRGAYRSEGNLLYWGHDDALDAKDVIDWIGHQSWNNQKVAMAGNSWLTASQWFIASERPKYLAAIAPWEGFSDLFRDTNRGGIPMPEFAEMIAETFSSQYGLLENQPLMLATHPYWCNYWQDKAPKIENVDVPAYVVASYTNDVHTHGTFDGFRRLKGDKWLRVHNTNEWLDFYTHQDDLLRFFDHYLKGIDNGWEKTPKVRLSVLNPGGEDVVDRVEQSWPLERASYKKLYLNGNSCALQPKKPGKAMRQTYNSEASGENRLVYRMLMDKDTEITGYMKLHLWVAAEDYDDMDLQVRIEKLDRNGNAISSVTGMPIAATGFMRVSMRKLDESKSTEAEPYYLFTKEAEQKLDKGVAYPVEIQIWPMGMIFNKGEYLQLTVGAYEPPVAAIPFGSAKITVPADGMTYDEGDENVKFVTLGGNANEVADKAEVVTSPATHNRGRHTILTGGCYDSYLYVPVIK